MNANFTNLGDTHRYSFPDEDIEIVLDCFSNGRSDGWKAMVQVVSARPPNPGLLHHKEFNLASSQSQATLVKTLAGREPDIDWHNLLEYVSHNSVKVYQQGEPVISLAEFEPQPRPKFLIQPLVEYDGATVFYGDGGGCKSVLCLGMALCIAKGMDLFGFGVVEQQNVLYLDWESGPETHYRRLLAMVDGNKNALPRNLYYRYEDGNLWDRIAVLRNICFEKQVGVVVVDSMTGARGGEPGTGDIVTKQFNALRHLKIPAICVDHVSKDPTKRDKQIDSVVGYNRARATWLVETEQEEGSLEALTALSHKKANNGVRQKRCGFRVSFANDEYEQPIVIGIEPYDVFNIGAFVKNMSMKEKIMQAIRNNGGAATPGGIASYLKDTGTEASDATVRARLNEYKDRLFVKLNGDKIGYWGLRAF